ncbi:hypothetical protein [Trueperella bialowiezensis]|uniref:DUF559 domain-containing protein n=1 Tax=Trueperella bialowiezensis TaxID=312285 RepID=A0A448PCP1_9ACTO|nr:hypothetical protein [Trueperella bialowiezensis]VEI12706.1 Uncharacterised protein [Trueperella bialowiezensis]
MGFYRRRQINNMREFLPHMAGHRFTRVFKDTYVSSDVTLSTRVVASAALDAYPQLVITGLSALQLRGIDVGPILPLHVASPQQVRVNNMVWHPGEREHSGGIAALGDALTDTTLSDGDIVIVFDEIQRKQIPLTDIDRRSIMNSQRLRELFAKSVDDSGSRRESATRFILESAGLPTLETQIEVYSSDSLHEFIGRADMGNRQYQILIEYEGYGHFGNKDQSVKDIARYARMDHEGWAVVRVPGEYMWKPHKLVAWVAEFFRKRGWRGRPRCDMSWLAGLPTITA